MKVSRKKPEPRGWQACGPLGHGFCRLRQQPVAHSQAPLLQHWMKSGVVTYPHNPRTLEGEQKDQEFSVILAYISSSRPTWILETLSKKRAKARATGLPLVQICSSSVCDHEFLTSLWSSIWRRYMPNVDYDCTYYRVALRIKCDNVWWLVWRSVVNHKAS